MMTEQYSSRVMKGSRPDRKMVEVEQKAKENKSQSKDSRSKSSGGTALKKTRTARAHRGKRKKSQ
jgi:hypothetical protein